MAIIVEDGTAKADAESYISVSDASTYHTNRGNSAWAALASDTIREQCLRKATEYMLQVYRLRWAGFRYTSTQALDWPRAYVPIPDSIAGYGNFQAYVDTDSVPVEVSNACAELALKAATATLYADQTQNITREKIGPIETEYDQFSPQAVRYSAVDAMLRPYLSNAATGQGIRA